MSNLEKKWWFIGTVSFLTALVTLPLLDSAGIFPTSGAAQVVIALICFHTIFRLLSTAARFAFLFAFPSSKLLD
ncbi:hypothetical protein [Pseudoduganella albidiflava]|uniref:Chlorhexidine efflux transporter domain-containing protein n=1 Tax=Pseudoduganella albidiflava TaxID=321983 RepID=A0A411WX16_9BURK|nr:hypothetical protein [Pseudoduganella albidiflava]QBI01321.1 hypothetical protein EYF70_11045 [Pseudoduganella albidiflava]GGY36608.1 hypothetical protein GCM10007387_18680 [Pseudoduganella albidiflava]